MKIFKYTLVPCETQTLQLPRNAQMLAVQFQHGDAQLWALVDETEEARELRGIAVYGTGHKIPPNPGRHLGTFQLEGGALAFHAFAMLVAGEGDARTPSEHTKTRMIPPMPGMKAQDA